MTDTLTSEAAMSAESIANGYMTNPDKYSDEEVMRRIERLTHGLMSFWKPVHGWASEMQSGDILNCSEQSTTCCLTLNLLIRPGSWRNAIRGQRSSPVGRGW